MKKLILWLSVLLSLSAFATSAKPRIIATYTDLYKEQPACWTRQNQDHVVLGTNSKVAGILKELCGFKDLELDQ
jgi:hypothetical protein